MQSDFLQMQGISKRFGATVALNRVDFAVRLGEVQGLVGENGSGKSTLMRVLAGAIQPDEGQITINGTAYRPRNPREARLSGIGMIHQELSLCNHLSVVENVMLGMEAHKGGILSRKAMRQKASEALAILGYPDLDLDTLVGDLNIAIRQVVEIARSIAVGCKIIVLDEPTSSLTEADTAKLFEVVGRLRNEGCAIIYISHFLDEIYKITDRVTVLRDGQLIGIAETSNLPVDQLITMMVGRKIEDLYPRSEHHVGEAVLDVVGLSGHKKPKDVSLTLHRGEVLGIAGLNGSGRTELIRCIFGLSAVVKGQIKVGTNAFRANPQRCWRQNVGMLSEDRKSEGLAVKMSISDNITLSSLDRLGPAGLVIPKRQNMASQRWIDELAIKCRNGSQPVVDLSGGNQQKVAIARLLQHDVDVFLLDEPTRGIDVGSKELVYRLIDKAASQNRAVLIVSSYLPELLGVCDRVAVMHKGRLGAIRNVKETTQEQLIAEAAGA